MDTHEEAAAAAEEEEEAGAGGMAAAAAAAAAVAVRTAFVGCSYNWENCSCYYNWNLEMDKVVAAYMEGHCCYSENGAEVFACAAAEEVAGGKAKAVKERRWLLPPPLQGSEEAENDTGT